MVIEEEKGLSGSRKEGIRGNRHMCWGEKGEEKRTKEEGRIVRWRLAPSHGG